jgi:antitoxin (DNA-binding transcriptional repressor) of toxin-antitoxin stability system
MRSMPVQEAETALADVVDWASRAETTLLTLDGAPVAVVLGFGEWQRLTANRRPLADLLLSFPEGGDLRRDCEPADDLDV